MKRIVGVDIGGTRTRVGAISQERILARRAFRTQGIPELTEAVREVLAEVGWAGPGVIGVGAPGPVDMRQGKVLDPPNLPPQWKEADVGRELREAFGCPVYLGNDATAAALGELEFGHRARDFVYITWSTGIGGGLVAGGRVVWGATGQAGEVGHMVLRPGGPLCGCGKRGCLETLAGGVGLARAAQERLGRRLSAREVVALARAGEPKPTALVDEACRAMGQAIAILWELLEPELIVLGGGFTGSWDFLRPRVMAAAEEMSRNKPRVELTPLGDDVGLLGAAALGLHVPRDWFPT